MDTSQAALLVKRAREDIGISQAELAERAGTSQSALAAIENGKRNVSEELLQRLMKAADVRPSIPLAINADVIRNLAASFGLFNVRVFGSVVRGDDTSDSDVDVLARYDRTVPFFKMRGFPARVEELVGFPVDLVLDDSSSPALGEIRRTAVAL